MARFGEKKLSLLRRFRPFEHGTPAHDHLGDIFATLDAEAFRRCFVAWVSALVKTPAEVIAIGGKTSRRSGSKKNAKEPIHTVSAFAARQRLVMGQIAVTEKSNEIVAIPALLDMMAIEGAVVTIDAMGCQRTIARKIKDKKADYILALKGNQGTLHDDVKLFVAEQKVSAFKDTTVTRHETLDGQHGRVETRKYTAIHDVSWLQERHEWPGLAGLLMVESTRELHEKTERETRFYITSLTLPAETVGPMIRDHWAIENALHWVMDMVFRDDECRVRTQKRAREFRHAQAHGEQADPARPRKGLAAPQAHDRALGRRLPRKPHRGLKSFTRFPCIKADWQFTTNVSRVKLKSLYPQFE